jgi:ABC-type Fe3+/spermidine/putrescine transport system ATPase subunit
VSVREAQKAVGAAARGAVEIKAVTKRFGGVTALDEVSLTIPPRSFFSLLGPSGCGKTTLLRILAGMEVPNAGAVFLDGTDITRLPPERRAFNIVFQSYALFPHLSVYDNVAFGLTTSRRQRTPRADVDRRVREMLALVGLTDFESRIPSQLSGGQAQRVAVARALIRQPELLLLDEPLSALDRNVRHALREELLRIHRELGTTFLLVTHDQDEALSMSQYVALMNRGRIEQIADPETLYRHPATLFAARFIGAGTFVQCVSGQRSDGRVEVIVAGRKIRAIDSGVGNARELQVLLRPEDLRVCAPGQGLPGEVETCAFFGAYYESTIRTEIAVFRAQTDEALAAGRAVGLTWDGDVGIAYPSEPEPGVPLPDR